MNNMTVEPGTDAHSSNLGRGARTAPNPAHHIADVLEALSQDVLTAQTKRDAMAISQSCRDVASLCERLAEELPDA